LRIVVYKNKIMRFASNLLPLILTTQAKLQSTQLSSNDKLAPTLSCGKAKIEINIKKQFLRRHGIRPENTDLHFGKKSRECFSFDNGDSFTLTLFSPFTGCETVVEVSSKIKLIPNNIQTVKFTARRRRLRILQRDHLLRRG
jgi:hypothetical protein